MSVDTANLAALGLPFVICQSTIFVYIPLFVVAKCNNSFKMSIANAVHEWFKQRSMFSKGVRYMIGVH